MRIDKWLWQARFFKTRGLCAKLVSAGKLRLNGTIISKPSTSIQEGDMLTFPTGRWVRVIEVVDFGTRRGPASEAQALYYDHSEPAPRREKPLQNPKFEGKGRPSGKDRRVLSSFSRSGLE